MLEAVEALHAHEVGPVPYAVGLQVVHDVGVVVLVVLSSHLH